MRIQATIGLHRPLDHPHTGGLKQAQDRPVARRLNHYRGVLQAQHGDEDFQDAAQVGTDVDIIGVPVTHGRRGVACCQGGAQLELAAGLRGRLRLPWILAQHLSLQQQQGTVERLQQSRLIGAQDQHPRTPGIDIDSFEQIAAAVLRVERRHWQRVITRLGHRKHAPFLLQQRIGVLNGRDRHIEALRQLPQRRQADA
ncbi:hypothetical protein D3C73_742060 [compost metagenome]